MNISKYFIILLLLFTSLSAKEKNIFFDARFEVPLFGEGTANNSYGNSEGEYSTPLFLGVSLGYIFNINEEWAIEPSVGYSFNTGSTLFSQNAFEYNYSDITIPLMYKKKGFKGGFFFKYMNIKKLKLDTFTSYNITNGSITEEYNEVSFKNKNPFTIGVKIVTGSWFYGYEYLFNGKYTTDNGRASVDIEGSRISVGIRNTF
ncbi:MAG TPA: hypothetical protein EYG94_01130 [Campylobacterales bacterium]|nr:hypothetical protein [Campylobacterales bacterium]